MSSSPTNYFARELDVILRNHGASFSDLLRAPFYFYPMEIQRLKNTLEPARFNGRSFPFSTLSPEKLTMIVSIYQVSREEIIRLKAALLTSFICVKLMERKPIAAMDMADRLFTIFVQVLGEDETLPDMLESGTLDMLDLNFEEVFAPILWRYDQALLSMHILGSDMVSEDEQINSARHAYHLLHQALLDLYIFPQTEQRQYLNDAIQKSKEQAKAFLDGLGIDP